MAGKWVLGAAQASGFHRCCLLLGCRRPPVSHLPPVQVFGLEAASATAASVRRQYKRLAALVHPDKCRLEGAAEGFKRLRAAADSLLEAVSGSGPPAKRARAERSGSGAAAAAADDAELSSGEEEEDGWVPNGGGFPWWSQWESVQPPRGASAGAACAAQLISSANQQQQQQGDAGGKGTGAGQDEEQAEERQLQGMALEELRAEVRRRQVAILEPALDAQGQRVPLQQLQAALRRARTVLADRVAAAAAVKAAEGGGGFLV